MKNKFLLSLLTLLIVNCSAFANVIKFVQVTDAHYTNNNEYRQEALDKAVQSINKEDGISFVIFTGDNIDSPKPEYLADFVKSVNKLKVPYYLVIGNHDVYKNGGLSKKTYLEIVRDNHFGYPVRKPSYVFKKNGFVFVVVDGAKEFIPGSNGYYKADTLTWLDKTLKKYKNSPVIIFQHFPLVEPKVNRSHEVYQKQEYLELLDRHDNVVSVVSGHFHVNGENMRNGVYHISTPTLLNEPNYYKVISVSTTKDFAPMVYTELKEVGQK